MLIDDSLLSLLVIAFSGILGFSISFLILKRKFNLDIQAIGVFAIFGSIIIGTGAFVYISYATHVIIEVRKDSNSKFLHSYNRLIGNWIFNVNDKTISTSELPDYETLIINYSEVELIIEPMVYSKSNDYTTRTKDVVKVSSKDYTTFNNVIQYFFDYNKPPKSIKVKNYEHETIRYWLHQM